MHRMENNFNAMVGEESLSNWRTLSVSEEWNDIQFGGDLVECFNESLSASKVAQVFVNTSFVSQLGVTGPS